MQQLRCILYSTGESDSMSMKHVRTEGGRDVQEAASREARRKVQGEEGVHEIQKPQSRPPPKTLGGRSKPTRQKAGEYGKQTSLFAVLLTFL